MKRGPTPLGLEIPKAGGDSQERPKAAKSVAYGKCPNHTGDRLVGLIRGGRHLYWRSHKVKTYGSERTCSASDAPLCSVPSRTVVSAETPLCPCGGRS